MPGVKTIHVADVGVSKKWGIVVQGTPGIYRQGRDEKG